MTVVIRTTGITAVRTVGMPGRLRSFPVSQATNAPTLIGDGYRHRAIDSLQALGLAIAASVLLTGLLWVAL